MKTPEDYGAVGDGISNDINEVQSAFSSGEPVQLTGGRTYRCIIDGSVADQGLILPEGARVDTSGSKINLDLDGDVYGIRMRSDTKLVGKGAIEVTSAINATNAMSINQSAISLGQMFVPNLASLGPYITASGWEIGDLTILTGKTNGYSIAGIGGVYHGHIHDVKFPVSNGMGLINFDWAGLGITVSQPIPTLHSMWPTSYYSVHPNNIRIERIEAEGLTNVNANALRLSAWHSITVDGFRVRSTVGIPFALVGGDYGLEFSEGTNGVLLRQAYLNTRFRDIQVDQCNAASAITINTYADNIFREAGYVPRTNPIYHSNIEIDGFRAEGNFSGTSSGAILSYADGVMLRRFQLVGFKNAVEFGDYATSCSIKDSRLWGNMGQGVSVYGAAYAPNDIKIQDNWICNNGAGTTNSGVFLSNGKRHKVIDNIFGGPGEGGQYYGVYSDPSVLDALIQDNYFKAIKSGGAAIYKGATPTSRILNNVFDGSIPSTRQII